MECTIETIAGEQYVLVRKDDGSVHQVHLDALGSWGVLLGIDDPGEVLETILTYEEPAGENVWAPLYEALAPAVETMVAAGVPAQFRAELLDPQLGAPVPGKKPLEKIGAVRARQRSKMARSMRPKLTDPNFVAFKKKIRGQHVEHSERRTRFLQAISPDALDSVHNRGEVAP